MMLVCGDSGGGGSVSKKIVPKNLGRLANGNRKGINPVNTPPMGGKAAGPAFQSFISSKNLVAPDPTPAVNPPTIKPGYRQPQADAGLLAIIAQMKVELKSRGGTGFIALQRKFRIMDDDGSKSLALYLHAGYQIIIFSARAHTHICTHTAGRRRQCFYSCCCRFAGCKCCCMW